ncbi:hypothetical protein BJ138DRAFT_1148892 [Hygrophoropsis aurantiaca]|uniref:Uncharacterized protein n=1 Tax=Hygrophoropsis aurantiaca TaxID=72124 RepID=A0ACB8AFN2_9AGAM|nr:hypothetical protein BJ138DRAFT_1148892 [Hygrophoropsis aurantiaca]
MASDAQNAEEKLNTFLSQRPSGRYTFDSERGAPQSEICREGGEKGHECIVLKMYSTKLFEAMQKHGFYCALPMDPTQTHMVCDKIPQS